MSVVKRARWIGIGIVLGAIALVFAGTPPTKTGNLEVTGSATVSGSAWVAGGVYQAGNQVVSIAGAAMAKSGATLGLASCGSDQVWLYDGSSVGSGWNCGSAGGGGVTNAAGSNYLVKSDGTNLVAADGSDDGTTWTVLDAFSAAGQIMFGGTGSPTAFNGTRVDNYNPSLSSLFNIRQDASADTVLTGLVAQPSGTLVNFKNSSSGQTITLSYNDTNSSSGNRFELPGQANWKLNAGSSVLLRYTSQGNWTIVASSTLDVPSWTVDSSITQSGYTVLDTRALTGSATYVPVFTGSNSLINSAITDDGSDVIVYFEPLQGFASGSDGQLVWSLNANGTSFIDTVVPPGGHGAATGETLAVGFIAGGAINGNLDSRDNHNQHPNGTAAGYFEESSTYDTSGSGGSNYGNCPTGVWCSYGINVNEVGARGSGSNALTDYGVYVHTANGDNNYAIYVDAGDTYLGAGNFTVHTGASVVQGLTATTIHATSTGQFDSTLQSTANVISTAGDLEATTGSLKVGGDMIWEGSLSYLYTVNAVSGSTAQDVHVAASGTGTIKFNDNSTGTNTGTGGLALYAGNNSSSKVWSVSAAGNELAVGNIATNAGYVSAASDIISTGSYIQANNSIYTGGNSAANYISASGTKGGLGCAYGTASLVTCYINAVGYGESTGNYRNLAIDDGKGHDIVTIGGQYGHVSLAGTAQSATNLSSCGTGSPAITAAATDAQGQITEGTTTTGCVLAFNGTYTVAPVCVCSATSAIAVGCNATTTALTIVNTSATGDVINYHCFGAIGSS